MTVEQMVTEMAAAYIVVRTDLLQKMKDEHACILMGNDFQ